MNFNVYKSHSMTFLPALFTGLQAKGREGKCNKIKCNSLIVAEHFPGINS
jgi:hypothetical protein